MKGSNENIQSKNIDCGHFFQRILINVKKKKPNYALESHIFLILHTHSQNQNHNENKIA